MGKVHIVDDDPEIRALLETYLIDRGYDATVSKDGESALEWLEAHEPEIILLDLCLPGIGGMELIRKISRLHPSVPIIVISGQAGEETAREALSAGAYDFFLKPFDLTSIESHLRMKLEQSEPAGQETGR